MQTYVATHDHDCRFLTISSTSEGVDEADVIGTLPWMHIDEQDREQNMIQFRTIYKAGVKAHSYGSFFRNAEIYYYTTLHWVGAKEVACVNITHEFPGLVRDLSRREMQVMLAMGCGRSTKEVAKLLGIKPQTVHVHQHSMRGKLGIPSIEKLVLFAQCFATASGRTHADPTPMQLIATLTPN